jgi:hypothetical protein
LIVQSERLSRRFDKLRDVFQQRKSSFSEIQSQLEELLPILGKDYRSSPLSLESISNITESTIPQDLDLSLSALQNLTQLLEDSKNEVQNRAIHLTNHLSELLLLWSELGVTLSQTSGSITLSPLDGPGPAYPSTSNDQAFDSDVLAHLGVKIEISAKGEEIVLSARERKEMLPTIELIERAVERRVWLEKEKTRREGIIQTLYDKMYPIWNKLGVTETETEEFLEKFKGVSASSVNGVTVFEPSSNST